MRVVCAFPTAHKFRLLDSFEDVGVPMYFWQVYVI